MRANTPNDIREATARLLRALLKTNRISRRQIVSAVFTSTPDLDADFPAHAARRLGWTDVPLLGAQEVAVPGGPPQIVRVLLTVASVPTGKRLKPVYLEEAAKLRPDLARASAAARGKDRRRIAIIGVGQIGGSIGLALGRAGAWWRVGYDVDPATLQAARAAGALDEVATSLETACAKVELAVLSTPVDTLPALVEAAANALPPGAALLDTGGARGPVTPALERVAARGVSAVGGHPIAGTEGRGLTAACADMFDGASFALSPTTGHIPEVVAELVRDVGAHQLVVTPEDHDAALARTSHMPYLVACALAEAGGEAARAGLSGPGFRDSTRLAASDPRVALAVCQANAREIGRAWQALRTWLDRAVAVLQTTEEKIPSAQEVRSMK